MNSSFGYLSLSLNASNELELFAGVGGGIMRINPNLAVEAGRGPLENREHSHLQIDSGLSVDRQ